MRKIPSRQVIVALIIAVLFFLLSIIVPNVVTTQLKSLATNTTRHVTTVPAASTVLNFGADCSTDAALSCFIQQTTTHLERTLRTSSTDNKKEVDLHVEERFIADAIDRNAKPIELIQVSDYLRLIRHSTYPVIDQISSIEVHAPSMGVSFSTGDFTRGGLQYFFPFNTERRSFDFFDVLAQTSTPLDYVENIDGVYEFSQTVAPVDLTKAATRSFTHPEDISDDPSNTPTINDLTESQRAVVDAMHISGTAARFYPEGGSENVILKPYYTVDRRIWVEPKSGVIVNQQEKIFIFYARNPAEALETARVGQDEYRTILATTSQWDAQTQQEAWAQAQPVVQTLRNLQIFAFIAQLIAGFFILVALRQYLKNR
ncbi:Protein of unknown function (DUF3068) [Corynebacterium kutscheri]|uniref:Integral membrane protein n=1 Tax=Corynebacterium kutscheri TaxID=35755 RepID=A0A0F6TEG0_9CORY|nr:DUF3068 domain-containing protein [Corynebacterium kutscheri]AKE42109.1 Protein of unknown function (DUF3068) [Corynebacterium kutscheri]VEH05963.1 putative integral membrane protein [Corynebacterium kutscheri]VEH10452.1 putative integral membrane protein [Corynebacterium kutscheri]